MNDPTANQMALHLTPERETSSAPRLAITFDHKAWLNLLADEWWPLHDVAAATIHLGVGKPCRQPSTGERIDVTVWIDPRRLPEINVLSYRNGAWVETSVRNLAPLDEEIIWPGPIPLFSAVSFSVMTPQDQARLLAMAKGFSNVGVPSQPVRVESTEARSPVAAKSTPSSFLLPPPLWNATRGAAAMAVWSVPALNPWLDVLCESLSISGTMEAAPSIKAPWWSDAPWRRAMSETKPPPMWNAMLEVFASTNLREDWRPAVILDSVCEYARQFGVDDRVLKEFVNQTRAILTDHQTVDVRRAAHDPLGLVLQLLLLRPTPERFVSWKDDLPAMPPVVWWTGATLSGFLGGFRDMEPRFRGTPTARQLLALRTWQLGAPTDSLVGDWPDGPADTIRWKAEGAKVQLISADRVWAERSESTRGQWYRANLANEAINAAAVEVARRLYPASIRRCLRIRDDRLLFTGDGVMGIDQNAHQLVIEGTLNLALPSNARLVDELDRDSFRDWLASGSIAQRLPEPPATAPHIQRHVPAPPPIARNENASSDGPLGLLAVPDFVSAEEEAHLLDVIDHATWLKELSRRVQHYGWKYDYKARKVDQAAYLGPLPAWAAQLGKRLLARGLIREMPDQVIVNEYVGNQGIAKHIDCPTCFRGPVVTVSLCESWQMIFRGPAGRKYETTLQRRSAVVMDGPARDTWTHEIPKRQKEPSGPRGRRVSLTFRKVDLIAPTK